MVWHGQGYNVCMRDVPVMTCDEQCLGDLRSTCGVPLAYEGVVGRQLRGTVPCKAPPPREDLAPLTRRPLPFAIMAAVRRGQVMYTSSRVAAMAEPSCLGRSCLALQTYTATVPHPAGVATVRCMFFAC